MADVTEWNQASAEWGRNVAKDAADRAYNQSLANNEGDRIALDKAKFAWQQEMDRSGLTGKFEDSWTIGSMSNFAQQFGSWMPNGPQAGQQTLTKEQQDYNQAYQNSLAYGQYYAPGTAPTQGQQTQAAINQQNQLGLSQGGLTGYYTDPQGNRVQTLAGQGQQFNQGLQTSQEQRAAQAQQQSQTQSYLQLLSSLRGPADWAKYQQVLGSTPGGMRDLYAAAMGQYVPGGGATTGQAPQAASLQSLMGDVSGRAYQGQGGGQLQQPNVYQGGQGSYGQQPGQVQAYGQPQMQLDVMGGPQNMGAGGTSGMWGDQGQSTRMPGGVIPGQQPGQVQATVMPGGGQAMIPGQGGPQYSAAQNRAGAPYQAPSYTGSRQNNEVWGSGAGPTRQPPTPQQQQQATGNGTNTMGNLPAPNQIAAQSWSNMAPSQQQMLLGQYESQGWDKNDVQSLMNQALPKYGSNSPTAGTWRTK